MRLGKYTVVGPLGRGGMGGVFEIKDDEGYTVGLAFKQGWEVKDVVPYQAQLYPVGKLADMEPAQIVWNVLMLELISDKFWKQNHRTAELAYTGEMVKVQNALIDAPETKALAVTDYQPLVAPELTAEDVAHDKVVADWDTSPSGNKRWLEERYKDRISKGVLNIMTADRQQITYMTAGKSELQTTTTREIERVPFWERDKLPKRYNMQALDPLPRQVQWLIYYHECGHILYGPSETSADCYAVRRARREGWLNDQALNDICAVFNIAGHGPVHPDPQARCDQLRQCFGAAS